MTAQPLSAHANQLIEITFQSHIPYANPFKEVTLDVIFTSTNHKKITVPAFWAGENVWRVRYSSSEIGLHTYMSQCSDTKNLGLHQQSGTLTISAYQGENPLYRHGGIKIAQDNRHFSHADNTPFFWLGDTWWMALCKRLSWSEDFQALTQNRKRLGFNVIQLVAGLYPDMSLFDARGLSESGFCWEKDLNKINPSFFDEADQKIFYLVEQGFIPCIIGAWGYYLPMIGLENMQHHWRYLMARWGALPVVWVAAGEQTMPWYLKNPQEKIATQAQQKMEWSQIISYMHRINGFKRLITTHPVTSARDSVTNASLLDFEMQQTNHSLATEHHALSAQQGWQQQPTMPVISGEARYEGLELSPSISAKDAREAFWAHTLNSGVAGHTYGANGIWQVNTEHQAFGQSPSGFCWGNLPWNQAMHLAGATQISWAKDFLAKLPWYELVPQPMKLSRLEAFLQKRVLLKKIFLKLKLQLPTPTPIATCVHHKKNLAVFYTITSASFEIDMRLFASPLKANWIDPTTFSEYPTTLSPRGKLKIKPPGKNAAGDNDWLLLLQPAV